MAEAHVGPDDVAGEHRARVGPMALFQLALSLASAVNGAVQVADSHPWRAALSWVTASFILVVFVMGRRERTVIDSFGVEVRAIRGVTRIPWDKVDFTTSEPSPAFLPADLTLRAKDGRYLTTQIPARRWAQVKAYGLRHVSSGPSGPSTAP